MSAFLSYSQQMRQTVRSQYPTLKNIDISSVLAQMWRDAAEEVKRPYLEQEQKDRSGYHEKMMKWKEEEAERISQRSVNGSVQSQYSNNSSNFYPTSYNSQSRDTFEDPKYYNNHGHGQKQSNNNNNTTNNQSVRSKGNSVNSYTSRSQASSSNNVTRKNTNNNATSSSNNRQIPTPSGWLVDYQDGSSSDPSSSTQNTHNRRSDSSTSKWGSSGDSGETSHEKSDSSTSDQALLRSLAMRGSSNSDNSSDNSNNIHGNSSSKNLNTHDKSMSILNPLVSKWNRVKEPKATHTSHTQMNNSTERNGNFASHKMNFGHSSTSSGTSGSGSNSDISSGREPSNGSGHITSSTDSSSNNPNYNHMHESGFQAYRNHTTTKQQPTATSQNKAAKLEQQIQLNIGHSNYNTNNKQVNSTADKEKRHATTATIGSNNTNNNSSRVPHGSAASHTTSGHTSTSGNSSAYISQLTHSADQSTPSHSHSSSDSNMNMNNSNAMKKSGRGVNNTSSHHQNSSTANNYNGHFSFSNQDPRHQKDATLFYENAMWGSGESYHPHNTTNTTTATTNANNNTNNNNNSTLGDTSANVSVNSKKSAQSNQKPQTSSSSSSSNNNNNNTKQQQQVEDENADAEFTTLFNTNHEDMKQLLQTKALAHSPNFHGMSVTGSSNSDMMSDGKFFGNGVADDLFNVLHQNASSRNPSSSSSHNGDSSTETSDSDPMDTGIGSIGLGGVNTKNAIGIKKKSKMKRRSSSGGNSKSSSQGSRKPSPLDVWPFNIGFDSQSSRSASRSVSGASQEGSSSDSEEENRINMMNNNIDNNNTTTLHSYNNGDSNINTQNNQSNSSSNNNNNNNNNFTTIKSSSFSANQNHKGVPSPPALMSVMANLPMPGSSTASHYSGSTATHSNHSGNNRNTNNENSHTLAATNQMRDEYENYQQRQIQQLQQQAVFMQQQQNQLQQQLQQQNPLSTMQTMNMPIMPSYTNVNTTNVTMKLPTAMNNQNSLLAAAASQMSVNTKSLPNMFLPQQFQPPQQVQHNLFSHMMDNSNSNNTNTMPSFAPNMNFNPLMYSGIYQPVPVAPNTGVGFPTNMSHTNNNTNTANNNTLNNGASMIQQSPFEYFKSLKDASDFFMSQSYLGMDSDGFPPEALQSLTGQALQSIYNPQVFNTNTAANNKSEGQFQNPSDSSLYTAQIMPSRRDHDKEQECIANNNNNNNNGINR